MLNNNESYDEFSQRFGRMLMNARGDKSIREASKEFGISIATISRIENGGTPDVSTLKKVCKWMKVDYAFVLHSQPVKKFGTFLNTGIKLSLYNRQTGDRVLPGDRVTMTSSGLVLLDGDQLDTSLWRVEVGIKYDK